MATTVYKRKSKITGAISFVAQVRVAPYGAQQETFKCQGDPKITRARATAWAVAKEQELRQHKLNRVHQDVTKITLGKLIATYVDAPQTKLLKSHKDIERLCNWWLAEYGDVRVLEFDKGLMFAGRDKLDKEKRHSETVNRYLSAMRGCWNFGRARNLVPETHHWVQKLMHKSPQLRSRFLDDAERTALLEAAKPDQLMSTAIIVSLACGMRQGELLKMEWKHVDLVKGHITMHETKNGTSRTVYLPPTAVAALQELRKAKVVSTSRVFLIGDGKPLQSSTLTKRFRALLKATKIPSKGPNKVTWHSLRHSCASYLAQNGASLPEIGSVLGHKSPSVTMRYSRFKEGAQVTGHAALDKLLSGK